MRARCMATVATTAPSRISAGVDLARLHRRRAFADEPGGDDDGPDDGGDQPEEDAGVAQGGVHRPLTASTRWAP